ncbi:unnamed protein product [Blepharisma stoltei]|uniref:non-specific serine/threonine protein kinase n=1 Tax=Blepharisma stoltei TaxID=1481888 RepID=A0AAU9JF11_9CILI|nr:unnamed protein product [Blepharisma stoltei]
MGNQVPYSQQPQTDAHSLLLELPSLSPQGEPLNSSRLFKSIKCLLEQRSLVLAKVYIKRDPETDAELSRYQSKVDLLYQNILPTSHPNILLSEGYDMKRAGILVRQFAESTLHQKTVRPPNLNLIEKRWIAFQMINAVFQLHRDGICHGDIKSDNFLLTSWNWVFLCDISSYYKPTFLKEGDLTSYKFYFTSTKRESCYMAPERFVKLQIPEGTFTKEMDIFSLGCCLAELYMDGKSLFSLTQLLAYQRGELDMAKIIAKAQDTEIVELLSHMICLDPSLRKSAENCLEYWKEKIISEEISGCIYPVMFQIALDQQLRTPDSRILSIERRYKDIVGILRNKNEIEILVPVVTSSLRNASKPSIRVKAIDLLNSLVPYLSDDCRLHRILPYMISCLTTKEERSQVKIACLKTILKILEEIRELSTRDVFLFEEYVWPAISVLKNDESEWVQTILAESLPQCARLGRLFLELSRYTRSQAGAELQSFEKEIEKFNEKIVQIFKDLLYAKTENSVQETLLSNFAELAACFDKKFTLNKIVSLLIPWLNKGDKYRVLIMQQIPKLVEVIGYTAFKEKIYPCIENAFNGHSEIVVYHSIQALRKLPSISYDFLIKSAIFLLHPNQWIRGEVIELTKTLLAKVDPTDNYCFIRPILIPYLTLRSKSVYLITNACVDEHLKKSFRRSIFEKFINKIPIEDYLPHEEEAKNSLEMLATLIKEKPQASKIQGQPTIAKEKSYENLAGEEEKELRQSTRPSLRMSDVMKIHNPFDNFSFQGKFQACFNEHEAAVTHLSVVEQNNVFISASNDGTVRIWDLKQLENFQPLRSRYTKAIGQNLKLKSLGVCGDLVFVGSEKGISAYNIETFEDVQAISSSSIIQGTAIDNNSLAYVTTEGILNIHDLRISQKAQSYNFGYQRGIFSTICVGPDPKVLGLGTLSGYLLLYDLRFNSLCCSYSHSKEEGFLSMQGFIPDPKCTFNTEGDGTPYIAAANGSDIVMWNIQTGRASLILTQASDIPICVPYLQPETGSVPSNLASKGFNEKPKLPTNDVFRQNFISKHSEYTAKSINYIQNWANFSHRLRKVFENPRTVRKVLSPQGGPYNAPFLLSAGHDSMIRFWDLSNPQKSTILGQDGSFKANFSSQMLPDILVIQEGPIFSNSHPYSPIFSSIKRREFDDIPPNRKIAHTDAILDMALVLKQRTPLLLTASRDGTIRAWN